MALRIAIWRVKLAQQVESEPWIPGRVGTVSEADAADIKSRLATLTPLDWSVFSYVTFVALIAIGCAAAIPQWPWIVAGHAVLAAAMFLLPARGAKWERPKASDSGLSTRARTLARFLRYTYPALLLAPLFEEVSLTVNALAPASPYWFEPYLYAADRALFGSTPSIVLSQAGNAITDELMHAFHFSYYLLIIGGIVLAWRGGIHRRETPARGFDTAVACMMLGFFLSYVWYPFLPARGPWENPALMSGLRPFDGWLFTPLLRWIISHASVSGGCFPSAHVSGTWALTFGLFAAHRRAAVWFGVVAMGLSLACVYLRYHHAVDVFAGFVVALGAAWLGYRLAPDEERAALTA